MPTTDPPTGTDESVDKARLASFSDNVISIAITLLVLDVHLPAGFANLTIRGILKAIAPSLQGFVLSFAIIGVYAVGHHMMVQGMKVCPRALLWVNNLFLLCVTLVPASAALLGAHPDRPASAVLYGLNIALVGMALILFWYVAVRYHRQVGMPMSRGPVRRGFMRAGAGVTIALAGVAFAAVSPWISYLIYWLAPFSYVVVQLLPIDTAADAELEQAVKP